MTDLKTYLRKRLVILETYASRAGPALDVFRGKVGIDNLKLLDSFNQARSYLNEGNNSPEVLIADCFYFRSEVNLDQLIGEAIPRIPGEVLDLYRGNLRRRFFGHGIKFNDALDEMCKFDRDFKGNATFPLGVLFARKAQETGNICVLTTDSLIERTVPIIKQYCDERGFVLVPCDPNMPAGCLDHRYWERIYDRLVEEVERWKIK